MKGDMFADTLTLVSQSEAQVDANVCVHLDAHGIYGKRALTGRHHRCILHGRQMGSSVV